MFFNLIFSGFVFTYVMNVVTDQGDHSRFCYSVEYYLSWNYKIVLDCSRVSGEKVTCGNISVCFKK